MKIFDCFMFYDEDLVIDLRLNILNEHVNEFVIVESKFTHSGKKRELLFDINKYSKFKKKINYIVLENEPTDLEIVYDNDTDDKKNSRRLIRLFERGESGIKWQSGHKVKLIGLKYERSELHNRIRERVRKMYANGLLEEAERINTMKLSETAKHAIGYSEAFSVLSGVYKIEPSRKTLEFDYAHFDCNKYYLPSAKSLCVLAEIEFKKNNFVNSAYFEPLYLKDFIPTISKKNKP